MIIEIATAATAIAATVGTIYAAKGYRAQMERSAPAIRVHSASARGGYALVVATVYPSADRQVRIRRISSSAEGIALAPYERDEAGGVRYVHAHNHSPSIDVDFDLLPVHVSSKSLTVHLSTKLRSSQAVLSIDFHTSRSRFSARHRINTVISNEAE